MLCRHRGCRARHGQLKFHRDRLRRRYALRHHPRLSERHVRLFELCGADLRRPDVRQPAAFHHSYPAVYGYTTDGNYLVVGTDLPGPGACGTGVQDFCLAIRFPGQANASATLFNYAGPDGVFRQASSFVITAVEAPSAVPEPAGWAMMIGTFGLVGGAMRGRQRTLVRFA